jgi:acetate kinase
MPDVILVLNAGSSSIKFSVFEHTAHEPTLVFGGQIEGLYTAPRFRAENARGETIGTFRWSDGTRLGHEGGVTHIAEFLRAHRENYRLVGVGHRVVHGGVEFSQPVRVTGEVLEKLGKLTPLAPLHQPHNLKPIGVVAERLPDLPQVACFDTGFHRAQPELAQAYALPRKVTDRGVRRYGFHGLSYEYIASTLPNLDSKAATGRVVVAHLGNGASMCAMRAGRSVASTMGFTAVDGLPMGTRCGALDPGVVLYLMDEMQMDARAVEKLLYQESGLLGVSGISSDMRTLLASGDARARFAVELFIYRIQRELGSLVAALGGLDALVFTGGIGERSAPIRARVCDGASWLGLAIDPAANNKGGPRINAQTSAVSAWTVPTNEELMIARHTAGVLAS